MAAPSFRTRVVLVTAGAVAATVLALTTVLFVTSSRSLVAEVDRALRADAAVVTAFVREGGAPEVAAALDAADAAGGDPGRLREVLERVRGADLPPAVTDRGLPGRQPGRFGRADRGDRRFLDVLRGAADRFGGATGVAQLVDERGEPVLRALAEDTGELPVDDHDVAVARGGAAVVRTTTVDDRPLRVLTTPVADGFALQVARPLDEVRTAQSGLARASLVVGGAGVLLSGLAGLAVAGRITEPVRALRRSAAEIAATGDPEHVIEVRGDDELADLATTFNAMLASLASARRTQRQLVADASHELRTPLTSLRTNVEVLQLGGLEDVDRRALLADVQQQLVELGRLVEGLVALARGDAAPSRTTPVELDDLVATVVDRARTHRRDVDVRLRAEPCVVLAARDELERAVANLVDNAVKYGGAHGPVDVEVADGVVRVTDRGPGIAPADRAHVFDRFWRAPEARGLPGSGLGLAIVAQTAAGHGGEVRLEHPAEGGVVAVLALPPLDAEDA